MVKKNIVLPFVVLGLLCSSKSQPLHQSNSLEQKSRSRMSAQKNNAQKTVIVTGGAGYIGSHTSFLLAQHGYHVIVIDNLSQGQTFPHTWATFFNSDFSNQELLDELFRTHNVHAVIHFAAFIEVGE